MSAYRLELGELARGDLEAIWDYHEPYSLNNARRLMQDIQSVFDMLAELPEAGRARDELGPGIRSFTRSGHVIIYQICADAIQSIRVVDGRQDWPEQF